MWSTAKHSVRHCISLQAESTLRANCACLLASVEGYSLHIACNIFMFSVVAIMSTSGGMFSINELRSNSKAESAAAPSLQSKLVVIRGRSSETSQSSSTKFFRSGTDLTTKTIRFTTTVRVFPRDVSAGSSNIRS